MNTGEDPASDLSGQIQVDQLIARHSAPLSQITLLP